MRTLIVGASLLLLAPALIVGGALLAAKAAEPATELTPSALATWRQKHGVALGTAQRYVEEANAIAGALNENGVKTPLYVVTVEGAGAKPPEPPLAVPPAAALSPTPLNVALPTFKSNTDDGDLNPREWEDFNTTVWGDDKTRPYVGSTEAVRLDPDGGVTFLLRQNPPINGSLQAGGDLMTGEQFVEADIEVGRALSGLIQAPLWLYNGSTQEEINFEIVGVKGLTAAINADRKWVWDSKGYLKAGDLTAWKARLGIYYRPGQFVRFYIDGRLVAEATPANAKLNGGGFPTGKLKSYHGLWPDTRGGSHEGWAGPFKQPTEGSDLRVKTLLRRTP